MLTINLDKKTESQFNKLLSAYGNNYASLINSMIKYRINELKKGIKNIELDFIKYEKKYSLKTEDFYIKYKKGEFGEDSHSNDFMIWSGEYEAYSDFQNELNKLL